MPSQFGGGSERSMGGRRREDRDPTSTDSSAYEGKLPVCTDNYLSYNIAYLAFSHQSSVERRLLDAFVRIEDSTAAGAFTGRRLHPPGGGLLAFPQGSVAPQARAGSDPVHEYKYEYKFGFRGRRSSDRRGVAPSPTLRPKGGGWIRQHSTETQRSQRVSRTVASEGYAHKYEHKGGLTYVRTNVAPRVTPTGLSSR